MSAAEIKERMENELRLSPDENEEEPNKNGQGIPKTMSSRIQFAKNLELAGVSEAYIRIVIPGIESTRKEWEAIQAARQQQQEQQDQEANNASSNRKYNAAMKRVAAIDRKIAKMEHPEVEFSKYTLREIEELQRKRLDKMATEPPSSPPARELDEEEQLKREMDERAVDLMMEEFIDFGSDSEEDREPAEHVQLDSGAALIPSDHMVFHQLLEKSRREEFFDEEKKTHLVPIECRKEWYVVDTDPGNPGKPGFETQTLESIEGEEEIAEFEAFARHVKNLVNQPPADLDNEANVYGTQQIFDGSPPGTSLLFEQDDDLPQPSSYMELQPGSIGFPNQLIGALSRRVEDYSRRWEDQTIDEPIAGEPDDPTNPGDVYFQRSIQEEEFDEETVERVRGESSSIFGDATYQQSQLKEHGSIRTRLKFPIPEPREGYHPPKGRIVDTRRPLPTTVNPAFLFIDKRDLLLLGPKVSDELWLAKPPRRPRRRPETEAALETIPEEPE